MKGRDCWAANEINRRGLLCQAGLAPLLGQIAKGGPAELSAYFNQLNWLDDPPSGPAAADNLMTNEDSIAAAVDQLQAEAPRGQAFIGVGPDQNYSLMAAIGPGSAYILDYRKKNQLLHLYHKAVLEMSETRLGYLEDFWARSQPRENQSGLDLASLIGRYQAKPLDQNRLGELKLKLRQIISKWNYLSAADQQEVSRIQARLAGPGPEARFLALKMYPTIGSLILSKTRSGKPAHWLATDVKYQAVRNLSLRDQIFPVVGDWAGTGCLRRLAEKLAAESVNVGAVYISDVEFFLMRGGLFAKYVANLSRLPLHSQAVIIRTSTREIDHPQRVVGQSSTTIVRPLKPFLDSARSGKIQRWDELFQA